MVLVVSALISICISSLLIKACVWGMGDQSLNQGRKSFNSCDVFYFGYSRLLGSFFPALGLSKLCYSLGIGLPKAALFAPCLLPHPHKLVLGFISTSKFHDKSQDSPQAKSSKRSHLVNGHNVSGLPVSSLLVLKTSSVSFLYLYVFIFMWY